jgi:hypothetical protein
MLSTYATRESRYLTRSAIVATLRATRGLAAVPPVIRIDSRDLTRSSGAGRIKPRLVTEDERPCEDFR